MWAVALGANRSCERAKVCVTQLSERGTFKKSLRAFGEFAEGTYTVILSHKMLYAKKQGPGMIWKRLVNNTTK